MMGHHSTIPAGSVPNSSRALPTAALSLALALLLLCSPANAFSASPFSSPFSAPGESNTATVSKTPVVICPGFGNDEIDYVNPLEQGDDAGLVSALVRRGFDPNLIFIPPLKRYEWIRVAGGLFDIPNFYTGNARPDGLGYGWYLKRLRTAVNDAYDAGGRDGRVLMIGHSAGGWLARAALGDGSWETDADATEIRASDCVKALVTVGAVHRPPAGTFASTCVTRGALAYVESAHPGAFLASEGIAYVSVGGDAIKGRAKDPKGDDASEDDKIGSPEANVAYDVRGEGSASSVAFTSYEAVSGMGELTGDGVVPLDWTLLEGSRTIVLEGVVHSINEAGTTIPSDRWYGSEDVIDSWLEMALDEAGIAMEKNGKEAPSGPFAGIPLLENFFARDSS